MQVFKAIICDVNGVLIKEISPLSQRVETDFAIPIEEFHSLLKSVLKKIRQPNVESTPLWQPILQKLSLSHDEFFNYWFKGEIVNQDLLQYIKELKGRGFITVILSNNFPERTNHYRLQYPQIFEIFDEEYFSWETGNAKPDARAFTQILQKHNFRPEEYVLLDDSDENLVVATTQIGIISHKYLNVADTRLFIESQIWE